MKIDALQIESSLNRSFVPALLNKDRYLVCYGGAGSGKSVAIAQKIIVRILKAMDKGKVHRFLCLRKTQPAARKSIFPLFLDILSQWGLLQLVKVNKSDMTITFEGGSQIFNTGLDDPEKIKSIVGITGVWIEEATEFSQDDFRQIDLRLRGLTFDYKQIIASFNPIDENHWIRKDLFTDTIQNEIEAGSQYVRDESIVEVNGRDIVSALTVMHSTWKDNQFLDDEYIALLEGLANQDKNYHNIYTLGKWGVLKGLIFDRYEITKEWPEQFDDHGFGLDFGYSVHPTGIVEVGFIGKKMYVRERCYQKELNNREIAARLLRMAQDSIVVADCAEPKSIAEIRSYGQQCVACTKGKDSIANGIQRIKQFDLYIDYNSPNLVKEIQGYKWAENNDGQLLNRPVDYNNHLIDALRYIVTRLKGRSRPGLDVIDLTSDVVKTNYTIPETDVVDIDSEALWQYV